MRRVTTAAMIAAALLLAGCSSSSSSSSGAAADSNPGGGAPVTVRLGFLSNITHASALVGLKEGFFTKALGSAGTLKATAFSSGTEETTAILAGQLDAAYVGPNPAITAWKSWRQHPDHLGRRDRRRVDRGQEGHHLGFPAQGQVAGHAVARQHAGRGPALLAQAERRDDQHDRRR